jgi:hypothetical protein
MERSGMIPKAQALPSGGGIGTSVAWAVGAQCWGQWRHDQALVGAERSRVGIWLGLHDLSKPDDNTGTRSGEAWLRSCPMGTGPALAGCLKMNSAPMKFKDGDSKTPPLPCSPHGDDKAH